jgi:hypothetical protein
MKKECVIRKQQHIKAVYVVFLGTQEQSLVAKHRYGYPKEKHLFFQQINECFHLR